MPVTFTAVNPNDTTPANNEVQVAVSLQPAMALELYALPPTLNGIEVGDVRFIEVSIGNLSSVDYPYVAIEFEDADGYEVRPVTSPTYNPETQTIVDNTEWETPQWTGYGYRVKPKASLNSGWGKGYWVKVRRRSEGEAEAITFTACGPCGDTGLSVEVPVGSGGGAMKMWMLPRGVQPEDVEPLEDGGIAFGLYTSLNPGDESESDNGLIHIDFVIDTPVAIPAGSWLRLLNGYQTLQYEGILMLYPMDATTSPPTWSEFVDENTFTAEPPLNPATAPNLAEDYDRPIQLSQDIPPGRTTIAGTLYGYAMDRIKLRIGAFISSDQAGQDVIVSSNWVEGDGRKVNTVWLLEDYENYDEKRPAFSPDGASSVQLTGDDVPLKLVLEIGTPIPPMSYLILRNGESDTTDYGGQHISVGIDTAGAPFTIQFMGSIPAENPQPGFTTSTDSVYRLTDGVPAGLWELPATAVSGTSNYQGSPATVSPQVTSDAAGTVRLPVFGNSAALTYVQT